MKELQNSLWVRLKIPSFPVHLKSKKMEHCYDHKSSFNSPLRAGHLFQARLGGSNVGWGGGGGGGGGIELVERGELV